MGSRSYLTHFQPVILNVSFAALDSSYHLFWGMEFKMKKVVLVSALLLSIGSIQAAESVRWDSASLSYQSVDIEGKLTGFGVSGTKLIGEDFFIAGSYSSVSDDDDFFGSKVELDLNTLSVGLG